MLSTRIADIRAYNYDTTSLQTWHKNATLRNAVLVRKRRPVLSCILIAQFLEKVVNLNKNFRKYT